MRKKHKHSDVFTKPAGCSIWWPNAAALLAEATHLTVEPHGEVLANSGDAFYAAVNVAEADEWCISAHCADKPSWIAASFDIDDLESTLAAALRFKGSRPIFYRSKNATFEIEGKTEEEMITFIIANDYMFDGGASLPDDEGDIIDFESLTSDDDED